jgi:GGDEF domain-containing protein
MEIRIGIIGPSDIVQAVMDVGQEFSGVSLDPLIYQNEEEAPDLAKVFEERGDVIIFTGPIPFHLVRKRLKTRFPMLYVPNTSEALISCLFKAACRDGNNIERASVDYLSPRTVSEGYAALGYSAHQVIVEEGRGFPPTDEIVSFHKGLFQQGKVDIIITGIRSAYDRLRALGLPAYRLKPTKAAIRETFQLAILEAKALRNKATQATIGILNIDNFSEWASAAKSEYEIQKAKLRLHQIVLEYVESVQASMTYLGGDEFVIFATRGTLEEATNFYEIAPLIAHVNNELPFTISFGLGLGITAAEAEGNARNALAKAKEVGGNSCFIFTEEGKVLGPLGTEQQLEYVQRSNDDRLINAAKAAGLSVATISRLESLIRKMGRTNLTANDIAKGFGITLRSGRRIIASLEQAGLAQAVGEEQPVGRGRPRQIYKVDFD